MLRGFQGFSVVFRGFQVFLGEGGLGGFWVKGERWGSGVQVFFLRGLVFSRGFGFFRGFGVLGIRGFGDQGLVMADLANPFLANPFLCCCVWLCVVCCVLTCVSVDHQTPDPPPQDPPLRRTAQNFAHFFPLPSPFRSFCLSLEVFSLNFGVFEGRDPQMCTFGSWAVE